MANYVLEPNQLNVTGTGENDTFTANSGSKGNFTMDGSGGVDTVDYSQVGQEVTLAANGIINKGGGYGFDTVKNVESFIGATGKSNTIDGTTSNGGGSFNIDLSKNNLTVNGLPAGPLSFNVTNFDKVIGTNNNDTIKGSAGNDTFIGSKGNDTCNGDGGNNTMDYSRLGTGVTLGAKGAVGKGALGTDTTLGMNKYVGASGQTNIIDGTTSNGAGSFNIDLSKNNLTVENLPVGPLSFEVVDFSQVVGTNNNDTIKGNNTGNKFTGGSGNDILTGGNGKDILNGTNSTARGVGEVDTLTGGGGRDTFALGDKNGSFYLGNGKNDYALINDFDLTKDRIQLGGNKDLLSVKFDRRDGTIDLFSKQSGGKDLVAKVKLANPFNFSSKGETIGMGNTNTAMKSNSVIGGEISLGADSIGGDSNSVEGMFANKISA